MIMEKPGLAAIRKPGFSMIDSVRPAEMYGAPANQHGGDGLWFCGVFERPRAWRLLDGLIALVMAGIGAGLLLGVSRRPAARKEKVSAGR